MLDCGPVTDVGAHSQGGNALGAKVFRNTLRRLLVEVQNPDLQAAPAQFVAGRLAHTRSAAGDHRDPAHSYTTRTMGLVGNAPLALAAGLGVNGIVAYQLAPAMTWPEAFGLVVLEGVCIVAASQDGNASYAPAATVTQAVPVTQRPGFTLKNPPRTTAARQPYGYSFLAVGLPAYTLAKGAPSWLSVSRGSGLVSGTPPASVRSFKYSLIASNAAGRATAGPFTVLVKGSPGAKANLSVKLSCPAKVSAGGGFTCTIKVVNSGPAGAKSVQVALVLPAAAYPPKLSGPRRTGNVLLWTPRTIASKKTVSISVSLKAGIAAHLALTALAWSPAPDPAPATNYATAKIMSVQGAASRSA